MENDTVVEKVQAVKPQKPAAELIWWKYDDGTYGSLRFDKRSKCCSDFRTYGDRTSRKAAIKGMNSLGTDVIHARFEAGIRKGMTVQDARIYYSRETDSVLQSFQELQTLITCYAKDGSQSEIMSLISLILSGYVARIYMKKQKGPTQYFSRAPLVLVRKHSRDLCGGFEHLQRIAESLIVDTSKDLEFEMHNPAVIPSHKRESQIKRCAYAAWRKDRSEYSVPTVYRDTAVLIHANFFKENSIREFSERNKWCTVLLFNMKKPSWQRLFAEIDMDKLTLAEWNWNVEKVHYLVELFVSWLSLVKVHRRYHDIVHIWKDAAENTVRRFNLASVSTGERIRQGSEWDLACLQITAVAAFIEFLYAVEVLDQESCETLFDTWANQLLPGSRNQVILERSQKATQESNERREQTTLAEFESLLQQIFTYDEGKKIYPLPKGAKYLGGPDLDLEQDPWAFLGLMEIGKKGHWIPVIKIRFQEIMKLAEQNGLLQDSWITQSRLKEILTKTQREKQTLGYIHAMDNVWLNLGDKGASYPGMTLIVEKMDFLGDSIRTSLAERISPSK